MCAARTSQGAQRPRAVRVRDLSLTSPKRRLCRPPARTRMAGSQTDVQQVHPHYAVLLGRRRRSRRWLGGRRLRRRGRGPAATTAATTAITAAVATAGFAGFAASGRRCRRGGWRRRGIRRFGPRWPRPLGWRAGPGARAGFPPGGRGIRWRRLRGRTARRRGRRRGCRADDGGRPGAVRRVRGVLRAERDVRAGDRDDRPRDPGRDGRVAPYGPVEGVADARLALRTGLLGHVVSSRRARRTVGHTGISRSRAVASIMPWFGLSSPGYRPHQASILPAFVDILRTPRRALFRYDNAPQAHRECLTVRATRVTSNVTLCIR
jgi:hypothetical protein